MSLRVVNEITMTLKFFTIIILLLISSFDINAQIEKRCGSVEYNESLNSQFPGRNTSQEFEKWMKQRIRDIKIKNDTPSSGSHIESKYGIQTYTIPLIFHIVHNGEVIGDTTNLNAQYISEQIEQLNLDFANLSGSTYTQAADVQIQFCAAKIDPQGNCLAEPGINRINRNTIGLTAPPYTRTYVDSSIKPITQWDPDDYANIWSLELTSFLGVAQFPEATYLQGIHNQNGAANTDGIVLKYSTIGSQSLPFPSNNAFNKGRTLTHEMGHWLGLKHIWGDGDCSKDDFCQDTPQQGQDSAGCPVGSDTCTSDSDPDMVENYMDYSNDDCMHTFTADQRDRMLVVMDPTLGSVRRVSLNNSPACGCAPIADFSPSQSNLNICSSSGTIQFENKSIRSYSNSTYSWTFSGAGVSPTSSNTEDPLVTLSSNGTLIASLTVTTASGTDTKGPISININSVAAAPSAPVLSNPANASNQNPLSPTLNWNSVPNADSYFIEVATDPAMSNVVYIDETINTSLVVPVLDNQTSYYWRVIGVNDCNKTSIYSGTSSPIWSFTTIGTTCVNYSATDTPQVISTSGAPSISSVITIPSGLGLIASIKISKLSLEHSYMADLTISLTNPSGISALLVREICSSNDDLNLIFSDTGSPNSSIPCPPTDGLAYQAQSPFTIYNGTDPAGNWILTISDAASLDGGNLLCWDLEICTENTFVCPGSLSVNTTATHINCNGQATGTVTATPTGGATPYTYIWQNSLGQSIGTTATLSNLAADTYTVFVNDGNGCVVTASVTITQPSSPLSNTFSVSNITCANAANGSITNAVSGGVLPRSYNWSTGATTNNISNLAAGPYTLTITDGNNCSIVENFIITEPTGIVSSPSISHVNCAGGLDGVISLSTSGGTAPYVFNWSNGMSLSQITGLAAGAYTVTITDDNFCDKILSISVNEPSQQLSLFLQNQVNVSCNGLSDGELDLQITGGTAPYTINWSNGNSANTNSNLTVGNYNLTVTDDNNCVVNGAWTITEPSALEASISSIFGVSCHGGSDGQATASVLGGSSPYVYNWTSGETGPTANNLTSGNNSVTITDNNQCVVIETFNSTQPNILDISIDQQIHETCQNSSDAAITVSAIGGVGPYTYTWSNGSSGQSISNLTSGTYTVTILDDLGCDKIETITLTEPIINVNPIITSPGCIGNNDGSIAVSVSGATAPYTYLWSNGQTTSTLSGVAAGTYSLTVNDDNSCVFTEIITVPPPTIMTITASGSNLNCANTSNGTVAALVTGGTAPYSYNWADSNGNPVSSSGLVAGTYDLTVTDDNTCQAFTSATINPPVNEYTMSNGNMLTGAHLFSADFEVDGRIESDQNINSIGNTIDYDSGMNITLKAGFEVQSGTIFHAFIDGCGGSM